ncbi:MAG: methyltransferase domain-containing protein [Euryarchaeota archaeon]|nr:methyltransferase domain-containing protein [Euryarchaeota archaeon]
MKSRLLDLLACYTCGSPLRLHPYATAPDGEIAEGYLECEKCREKHPIIHGVPRVLPEPFRTDLRLRYPDFFQKYPDDFPAPPGAPAKTWAPSREVADMYAYGWSKFTEAWAEFRREFLHVVDPPLTRDSFRDKLILDAGCGQGRFSRFMLEFGAREVVAFDLGEQVDTAHQHNLQGFSNSHVLQADIYHIPLKAEFDLAISIGVLHHLPDPEGGFRSVTGRVRPGGAVFAWVYGWSPIIRMLQLLRKITRRIPRRALFHLAVVPTAVLHILNLVYALLDRLPRTRRLARRVPLRQYSDRSFRGKHWIMFDHLSVPIIHFYREGDLEGWLRRAGLRNIVVTERYKGQQGSSWRGYGEK